MSSPDLAERTIEEDVAAAMEQHTDAAPADDTGPARGPDGKFAPAEAEPAPPGEAPPVAEVAAAEVIDDAPAIPDKFAIPPTYAKKAIREKWTELPPEVRQEIHERETDIHRQFTRFDDERTFGKQVKEVVAPYEPFIRSLGADPVQALDYLLKTDYALRTAPPEARKQMFMKAAADYGIQFGPDELGAAPQGDPRVETLAQQIARLEQAQQSDIQARQLQEQQSLEQQIADFASRPDKPFFDRVSPIMASLLQSGQVGNLEEAYDQAVWADPETRALQLAAEQSQRSSKSQAAVDKARAASASVTGAPGLTVQASSPTSSGSLEDDIRAAMNAASGRI